MSIARAHTKLIDSSCQAYHLLTWYHKETSTLTPTHSPTNKQNKAQRDEEHSLVTENNRSSRIEKKMPAQAKRKAPPQRDSPGHDDCRKPG